MSDSPPRRLVLKGLGATAVLATAPIGCGDKESEARWSRPEGGSFTPDDSDSGSGDGSDGAADGTDGTDGATDGSDGTEPPVARDQFNVLYISSDELNYKYLGHRGHPEAHTPRIDALAAESLQLTRVYCSFPSCAPTRQSLLTGLYSLEHGQFSNAYRFSELYPTLPALFTAQGFRTANFGKMHTWNDEENLTFGFEDLLSNKSGPRWDAVVESYVGDLPPPSEDPVEGPQFRDMPYFFGGKPLDHVELDDDWALVHEAIEWMRANQGERFFLYVSLRAPHYPFNLPRDYYYLYDPASIALPEMVPDDRSDSRLATHYYADGNWAEMSESDTRLVLARYLGAIAWLDHLVGILLDELDDLGLADRTVVAFTTDHGDMCGEKGLWLKNVFFDSSARKPFLVRMPGHITPGEDDLPLGEVDLWPTMAGLVQATEGLAEMDISGQDRSALLLGEDAERPPYTFSIIGGPDETTGMPWVVMAVGPRYKLWRFHSYPWQPDAYEMCDLVADPDETENIYDQAEVAEVRALMEIALDEWLAGLRDPIVAPERVVPAVAEH